MNGYRIGSLRVNTRKGFLGCAGAAAMTYILVLNFKFCDLPIHLGDRIIRNGDENRVTIFDEFAQVGIVSGICKFCGFSCAVGIAAVIAGYPHAFFGKQSAEGKADFSCSNNANVHAVTRFLWCDAT